MQPLENHQSLGAASTTRAVPDGGVGNIARRTITSPLVYHPSLHPPRQRQRQQQHCRQHHRRHRHPQRVPQRHPTPRGPGPRRRSYRCQTAQTPAPAFLLPARSRHGAVQRRRGAVDDQAEAAASSASNRSVGSTAAHDDQQRGDGVHLAPHGLRRADARCDNRKAICRTRRRQTAGSGPGRHPPYLRLGLQQERQER